MIPLDAEGSGAPPGALSQAPPPDALYDREWALAVLERGLAALEAEYADAGQSVRFAALKPRLDGAAAPPSQAEAAAALGLSEGAVKVAIHRLRSRFRQLVSAEIAGTLEDPAELGAELAYLIEALSRG